MKTLGWLAGLGAGLGAAVGVLAHFMSRTVPHVFYVGMAQAEGSNRVEATLGTPLVHPSWWPTLFVAILVGAAVGLAAGAAGARLGIRVVRETVAPPGGEASVD